MSIKGYKDANGNIQKYDINALYTSFTAEIGQVLVVEEIDENGHPIKFNVVDQPDGVEITSGNPTKENTVMTFNPDAEDLNLYSAEETDEKFAALGGTVEITDGNPTKDSTLLTVNPDAEEKLIYEAGEVDEIAENLENQIKEIGGVEVTSGEPTKESTVMTVNPNAEKVKLYTALEIDEMLQNLPSGNGGDAIIDVVELPTENIVENAFYRLLTAKFLYGQFIKTDWTLYTVDALPETGEMCWDGTTAIAYFNASDNLTYGYVNAALSSMMGVPEGWYTADILIPAIGSPYGGLITSIMDAEEDTVYTFIEYKIYSYKEGVWISSESIGWRGTGESSEIFNHLSNVASGSCSHAEGYTSHAKGFYSHAEGYGTYAEGNSSHAEGFYSHAEGKYSHTQGYSSYAKGDCSHAQGHSSHAQGDCSHAEGYYSHAEGDYSHAEGCSTHAEGGYSHAQGLNTVASANYSHAQGKYNIKDTERKYAHIVGNGENDTNRSNAHTLDWSGNAEFQGDVLANACGGENPISLKALAENTYTKTQIDAMFGSYVTDIAFLIGGDA